MCKINTIKEVLKLQSESVFRIPVDVVLRNGNIVLRSFRILKFDEETGNLKGLTLQEEYCYPREQRAPQYCYFSLEEIKEVYCDALEAEHLVADSALV